MAAEEQAETPPGQAEPGGREARQEAVPDAAKTGKAGAAAAMASQLGRLGPQAAQAGFKAAGKLASGLVSRLKGVGQGVLRLPVGLVRLLLFGDLTTRILVLGLLASATLLALTSAQLYHRFLVNIKFGGGGDQPEFAGTAVEFFKKQKDLTTSMENLVFMDSFSASLRSEGGSPARAFEVEMFIESDTPETGQWMKAHLDTVRESVSVAMQGQVYEHLLTADGKEEFKDQILKSVNQLFKKIGQKGRVKKVYFTRLVVGG